MKQFLAPVCAATSLISNAHAGSERFSTKDATAAQPFPNWYANREWDVSLWGTYTFTSNDYPTLANATVGGPVIGRRPDPEHDRYLEADHAWGGGIDAKFFFARYFGIGVAGYALDVRQSYPDVDINFFNIGGGTNIAHTAHDRRAIGAGFSTFTFRYPLRYSRLAPYIFGGGGAIFGGGQRSTISTPGDRVISTRSDDRTKLIGQVGAGFEVRLTPHVGLTNDFAWNIVDGRQNNFGMARTGINFAF